jgi:GrpB-like predicted nucleotidyltransferase (UPF0157 family)
MSRSIHIAPYDPTWPAQFQTAAQRLGQVFAQRSLRIDHIGSTAVTGLAAKDIIDIQITVSDLRDLPVDALRAAGLDLRPDHYRDFFVGIDDPASPELAKRMIREPAGERRTHIHVRQHGRFNQRYALLFRDYLRASPVSRKSYQAIKIRLAEIFPQDIDGYISVKDPVMDLLYEAAEHWARQVDWAPGDDFV